MSPATNLDMLKEALWRLWGMAKYPFHILNCWVWIPVRTFFYNIGQIFKYSYRCVRYGKDTYA